MPKKKKTGSPEHAAKKEAPMTKAAFIRSHPSKKAAEVVELAKAQGMTLTVPHVYVVRTKENSKKGKKLTSSSKSKHGHKPGKKVAAKTAHRKNGHASHANLNHERLVRDIIFHVGFDGLNAMVEKIHNEISH